MRKLPLLAALAVTLAACDSAAPTGPDALIGEWTAVGTRSETLAESSIDQQVPHFGAEAMGDLAVTGGAGLPLHVVASADPSNVTVRASAAGGAKLQLRESSRLPSEARLDLDDSLYTARFAVGADLFTFVDGRLTVPEITLIGADGARRQVRVGGVRTLPMRTLRAGEEVVTTGGGMHPLRPDLGAYALKLVENGTARRREIVSQGSPTPTFGRWEASETDELTLTFDGEPARYRYRFEDGALVLERPGAVFTEGEALRSHEAQLFAESGSLVRLRYLSAVVFQSQEVSL